MAAGEDDPQCSTGVDPIGEEHNRRNSEAAARGAGICCVTMLPQGLRTERMLSRH